MIVCFIGEMFCLFVFWGVDGGVAWFVGRFGVRYAVMVDCVCCIDWFDSSEFLSWQFGWLFACSLLISLSELCLDGS